MYKISQLLNTHQVPRTQPYQELEPTKTVLVIDAFYRSKHDGTLVFRSPELKRNLLWFDIASETVNSYLYGVHKLQMAGWEVSGFTVDGRKGIVKALSVIAPTQYCQFHQKQTIRRHLTLNPQHPAAIELKDLAEYFIHSDEPSMRAWLDEWYKKHQAVMKEKTMHPSGSWSYTHRRLRAAYFSLNNNLTSLYSYHHYKQLPNTTNSLDGSIRHIRTLHRVHQGIKLANRRKLTDETLRGKYPRN